MAEKQDMPMNAFKAANDAPYVYAEASDGSQVKISKADLMRLISTQFPQIERLNYGLGGINHVNGNTEEIPANKWVYANGFADGDVVTMSLEAGAGVTVNFYRDDGYTMGHRFTTGSGGKIVKTTTNVSGKPMLIFAQDGPIKKLMVEKGYFASEWKQG